MAEHDYVLGTHDEEIERLGLQHRVWRTYMLEAWRQAGITVGSNVLDVGAGPGYATLDLAQIVGATGRVIAFERSERFFAVNQARLAQSGIAHVEAVRGDLVLDPIPARELDAAWCRWVLCFVSDPALVVGKVAQALRPGGRFAIHEYVDYETWQTLPDRPAIREFVRLVVEAWRQAGGEPNIARDLPRILEGAGFRVVGVRPIVFAMRPADYAWKWPEAFIRIQPQRMREAGQISEELERQVVREIDEASADPRSLMLSPMVLELIAEKL